MCSISSWTVAVSLFALPAARSFYTKDKAIRTPEDLKGLKIRVQDMESQTETPALFTRISMRPSFSLARLIAAATDAGSSLYPVARYLTNVSVCFIQLSKSCGESVLLSCKNRCRAGKRGLNQSCSAVTACYSSSISKAISNPKIILISASLMSPFNSISTTI